MSKTITDLNEAAEHVYDQRDLKKKKEQQKILKIADYNDRAMHHYSSSVTKGYNRQYADNYDAIFRKDK